MKRNRSKGLVLFLMLILVLTASIMPTAAAKPDKTPKVKPAVAEQIKPEKVIRDDAWQEMKTTVEAEKARLELVKDELEAAYELLMASGETEAALVKAQELAAAKTSFRAAKAELKSVIRNGYTAEELSVVEAAGLALAQADPTIQVLPVENIIVKGKHLGFDTPPVIKSGRTLVPVKALVQAFGAEVAWNPVEKTVTIIKDELTLILTLGETQVLVNGEPIELDVPAQAMNGRTVVPLRFIVEQLGFVVDYEDGDITIDVDTAIAADEEAEETVTAETAETTEAVETAEEAETTEETEEDVSVGETESSDTME